MVGEVVELGGEAGGCGGLGGFAGIGAGVAAEDGVDCQPGGFGAVFGDGEPEEGVAFAAGFEDAAIGDDGIDFLDDPLVGFCADFEFFAVPAEFEFGLLIPADPDDVLNVLREVFDGLDGSACFGFELDHCADVDGGDEFEVVADEVPGGAGVAESDLEDADIDEGVLFVRILIHAVARDGGDVLAVVAEVLERVGAAEVPEDVGDGGGEFFDFRKFFLLGVCEAGEGDDGEESRG